jgi:mitochondrial fission protein ELM1
LFQAANHFLPLLASLPRPLVSVLVGGKNKHQDFTPFLARDFAQKLIDAAQSGHGLAVSFSRRTGQANEAILREALNGFSCYIWDGKTENPYLGFLSLSDAIIVTSDSISMLSEACSTGKPVYIYELPNAGRRHQELVNSLIKTGKARYFKGKVEKWDYTPLAETQKAADFVIETFRQKSMKEQAYANFSSRNSS